MTELTETTQAAEDVVMEAVESEAVGEQHHWHRQVALTTMIMALLAALGGLLAGITANEALLDRTREIIEVSYLEGDRAYVETIKAKHEILAALGEKPDPDELETVLAFEQEIRLLEADASREEVLSATAASAHEVFAIAVTLLSLGITMAGMGVVVNRKVIWVISLVVGVFGAIGVGLGVLSMLA
jgi:hypothetical protein